MHEMNQEKQLSYKQREQETVPKSGGYFKGDADQFIEDFTRAVAIDYARGGELRRIFAQKLGLDVRELFPGPRYGNEESNFKAGRV